MPEVTIHFNLPEEREEFTLCANAAKWKTVAEDVDNWLRGLVKYGISKEDPRWGTLSEEKQREIEGVLAEVRSFLNDAITGNGLELYE